MQAGGKSAKPKVALVSLQVMSDPRRNLCAIAEAVERAAAAKCELVCFPECALTGLVETKDYKSDIALATEVPGDTTDEIAALAKKHHLYIAIGIMERDRGQLYDTAILIDSHSDIILKYRRINPRWHVSSAPEHLYCQGTTLDAVSTSFGRIAFAICGDMFDEAVISRIQNAQPDYLIVPLARSYANHSHEWWENEEKAVYSSQVGEIGVMSFLVNSFEAEARWPSFGGSLVVSSEGQVLAETRTGTPSFLTYDTHCG